MFSLSKKTEYGLMALIHLSRMENSRLVNVAEIARSTSIPRELLAKILSELVRANLAISHSGPAGGFRLARPASTVSLSEVFMALESKTGLSDCLSENGKCVKAENCVIKPPMARLNKKFRRILEETKLDDFITPRGPDDAIFRSVATQIVSENK